MNRDVEHEDVRINQVSHTIYFITARMSTISIAGPFSLSHKAAFDSFLGGTYGVSSFLLLAFLGDAGLVVTFSCAVTLDAFVVMTVLFYNYKCKGITFPVFRKRNFIFSVAVARMHIDADVCNHAWQARGAVSKVFLNANDAKNANSRKIHIVDNYIDNKFTSFRAIGRKVDEKQF
jgi:hypothetical protein